MSTSEITPLNTIGVEDADPELDSFNDDERDILAMDTQKRRDPLHILVLYGLSFSVSVGGLGAALWGYGIAVTAPFDEYSKKQEREGYEKYFWGMQSIVVLVFIINHRPNTLPLLFVHRKVANGISIAHHQYPLERVQLLPRMQRQPRMAMAVKYAL